MYWRTLSSKLTDISGSSSYTTLNLVTYALEAKRKMLGVTVGEDEVVSEKNALIKWQKGLHELTNSDICISTTGNAGPTGNPVGLMYSTILQKINTKLTKSNLIHQLLVYLYERNVCTRSFKKFI